MMENTSKNKEVVGKEGFVWLPSSPLMPSRSHGPPGGSDGKESSCNAEDPGLIPGWGRYPGEGNGYPLQYSLLENSIDRGAWWVMVYGEGDDRGLDSWTASLTQWT